MSDLILEALLHTCSFYQPWFCFMYTLYFTGGVAIPSAILGVVAIGYVIQRYNLSPLGKTEKFMRHLQFHKANKCTALKLHNQ